MDFSKYFKYSKSDGSLIWLCGKRKGKLAGCINKKGGYLRVTIDGVKYLNHKVVASMHGVDVGSMQIDHINGITTDNRIENLRITNQQGNMRNRRAGVNNKTGVVGVSIHPSGLYHAHIRISGKRKNIGYSMDKFEAICMRMSANNLYGFHENHGR